jgi:hypothetical protein
VAAGVGSSSWRGRVKRAAEAPRYAARARGEASCLAWVSLSASDPLSPVTHSLRGLDVSIGVSTPPAGPPWYGASTTPTRRVTDLPLDCGRRCCTVACTVTGTVRQENTCANSDSDGVATARNRAKWTARISMMLTWVCRQHADPASDQPDPGVCRRRWSAGDAARYVTRIGAQVAIHHTLDGLNGLNDLAGSRCRRMSPARGPGEERRTCSSGTPQLLSDSERRCPVRHEIRCGSREGLSRVRRQVGLNVQPGSRRRRPSPARRPGQGRICQWTVRTPLGSGRHCPVRHEIRCGSRERLPRVRRQVGLNV